MENDNQNFEIISDFLIKLYLAAQSQLYLSKIKKPIQILNLF